LNPYESLPPKAFWRPAVADRNMFEIEDLWTPKLPITETTPVATFGSCFAQHIGKALAARGYNWLITEQAPFGMSAENAKKFNYGVFSARTGNIYTTTLLRQWANWAAGATPPDEVWGTEGAYIDPFRPVIEPGGFATVEELRASRQMAIDNFRECIVKSKVFVFTLGLTESWVNAEHGYEYPMCPGTAAGEFDADKHKFVNLDIDGVRTGLAEAVRTMLRLNRNLTFLFTVSPVPLTATNSGQHVAVATMFSKSVLRAVAGQMATLRPFADYFPSYEIINSPVFKGAFFEPNQRNVSAYGVNFVMENFFKPFVGKTNAPAAARHGGFGGRPHGAARLQRSAPAVAKGDEACEEAMLAAFGAQEK